ncbi:5-formyltetrahydrofolate cyclo-ligase [Salinarchaeum sp. Harcht-Bsk1]|uniref:5-formyltetrahydrofolate cyclo-ligase n=1 Tax=Salinarchaeum sp. Harcht-Bsk1 TaxID=1333523 RepID=UPI0003422A0D|nr:5-formyltetrahydrofolate cyclo-ligase [Salinarchaeum sp. Harcht-Bsk1]AGN02769.1 5-formyltetrahydrofolate cyclo-ligase [Salinarchaeum sp. Harcht-Bsk1]
MSKQSIRDAIWDALEDEGIARFPFPPHDRIPNFAGASEAAQRLSETDEWAAADVVKANPDAPQLPVRRRALRAGKTVYVAVPRLADEQPFRALDPEHIAAIDGASIDDATTISGIDEYGEPVGPEAVPHVDLIVSGSVAVSTDGTRIGKGEGYSDLEFAVLSELGAVDESTTVVTTVHDRQVLDDLPDPGDHDVPLDLLVTPERTIRTERSGARPEGVDWPLLDPDRIAEIPVLQQLQS